MKSDSDINLFYYKHTYRICLYGILFFFFAALYGLIPSVTFPDFDFNYWYLGEISGNEFFHTSKILYPYGRDVNEGFYFYFIGKLFYFIFKNEIVAVTLTYLSIYAMAFISLAILGKVISNQRLPTLFLIILFFLDPFLLGNMGIPVVGYGMMIAPLSVVCDYLLWKKIESDAYIGSLKLFLALFFCRLIVVSIGWYSSFAMSVFSFCFIGYGFLKRHMHNRFKLREWLKYFYIWIIPWALSVGILYLFMPKGTTELSTKDINMFNGCSISIGTLFLPGKNQFIAKLFSTNDLIPQGFSLVGDITMWNNYLGISILVLFFIALFKRDYSSALNRDYYIGITCALAVGLILSLGPGLKIFGLTELSNIGKYKGYFFPMEEVIRFPWSNMYLKFPLNMMRAVYRWLIIAKLCFLVLASYGLTKLWNENTKYKLVAIFLTGMAIIEFFPAKPIDETIIKKINTYNALNEIKAELVYPLKNEITAGDKLAICSYDGDDNGIMLPYIMQDLDAVTFAGTGDKSMILARKYIPEKILALQRESNPHNIARLIGETLDENICDGVLLPYFSIRWASYYWPWDDRSLKYKELVENVKTIIGNKYHIYENRYYMYVKKLN